MDVVISFLSPIGCMAINKLFPFPGLQLSLICKVKKLDLMISKFPSSYNIFIKIPDG